MYLIQSDLIQTETETETEVRHTKQTKRAPAGQARARPPLQAVFTHSRGTCEPSRPGQIQQRTCLPLTKRGIAFSRCPLRLCSCRRGTVCVGKRESSHGMWSIRHPGKVVRAMPGRIRKIMRGRACVIHIVSMPMRARKRSFSPRRCTLTCTPFYDP